MKRRQNCTTGCDAGGRGWVGCETGPFPSVFKEGWLRLNKKVPFLSGADGVVSKFQQKLRCATWIFIRRLRDLLLTTPSAPLRNEDFLLRRSHPSLKTEGNELASRAVIDFEIASLGQSPEFRGLCALQSLNSKPGTILITDQFSIFTR